MNYEFNTSDLAERRKNRIKAQQKLLVFRDPVINSIHRDSDRQMQFVRPDVQTICMGLAASIASFILVGGEITKRIAFPHAWRQ